MTELLDVLNVWTTRYGLDEVDRTNVSLAVGWAVRGEKRYPPMPAELAAKLGTRTWASAMERFLLERFGWNEEGASPEVHVPPAPVESAPEMPLVEAPHIPSEPPPPASAPRAKVPKNGERDARGKVVRRCSVCREPGHRFETCPKRMADPANVRPAHKRTWRGFSAAGGRVP